MVLIVSGSLGHLPRDGVSSCGSHWLVSPACSPWAPRSWVSNSATRNANRGWVVRGRGGRLTTCPSSGHRSCWPGCRRTCLRPTFSLFLWDCRNESWPEGTGRAVRATLGSRKAVTRGALACQCFRHSASQLVSKASWLYQLSFKGFPHSSVDKQSACNAGDPGSIPGWERSPGEGNGNPLQYSRLENPTDRGAWQASVHGVARAGHDLGTKPQH